MKALLEVLAWIQAHPGTCALALYFLGGLLTALKKPRSAEEYAKLPRWWAAILKGCAAIFLDPPKLVEAAAMFLRIPSPYDGSHDAAGQLSPEEVARLTVEALTDFSREARPKNPEGGAGP